MIYISGFRCVSCEKIANLAAEQLEFHFVNLFIAASIILAAIEVHSPGAF